MKTKWLNRRIAAAGPYLCLCLSSAEFDAAIKHLGVKFSGRWITDGADATTHHMTCKSGSASVVCIDAESAATRGPIEVSGLLVHEAVHVWQEYCEGIGEREPGREQEAYAVQSIAQELMAEYARRMI